MVKNKSKDKISILVADGKMSKRRLLVSMLRKQGFNNFDEAPDGAEAFQILKRKPIDFIISGMDMPEMNGLSLLRVVSSDEKLYRIPFILIAPFMKQDIVLEAGKCGVAGIIIDPVKAKVLEEKLTTLISGPAHEKDEKVETLFEEALEQTKNGNYSKALTMCQEVLKAHEDAEVYYNIGYIKSSQKKFDEALVAFRKAVMIDNLHARAFKMMGNVYSEQGNTEEAQHYLQKAGEIFMERNMDAEAEEAFQEVIKINPNTVNIYNSLGILYRKKGDFGSAIKQYEKAMKVDPEDENIMYNAGRAYIENKEIEKAKGVFKLALEINPDFEEAKKMLQAIEVGF